MSHQAYSYIINDTNFSNRPIIACIANTFLDRFIGFMFRSSIKEDEGLLLVLHQSSRTKASIHMTFINFNLGIIWLNDQLSVTQVELAHKWTSIFFPTKPAKYILEIHPSQIPLFAIGDRIHFEQIS
jgi:uncharacterized membrane protein (UPF0127 family)